jgi:(p)ppGpp synthase/HD superfamily hydrolase
MTDYEKKRISLRYFLLGAGYYKAADAMEYAGSVHTGFRKDGITPEFAHQIEIAHYMRTLLPSLMYPEDTLAAILLHDTTEDYNIPHALIADRFGERVGQAVYLLDKNGKTPEAYYSGNARDPIASVAKGGDRIHNVQTMVNVFTIEKQHRYLREIDDHFLPMLKAARRLFPQQEAAYENIKHVLTTQTELIELIHVAQGTSRHES